jgi:hypothetical protein
MTAFYQRFLFKNNFVKRRETMRIVGSDTYSAKFHDGSLLNGFPHTPDRLSFRAKRGSPLLIFYNPPTV